MNLLYCCRFLTLPFFLLQFVSMPAWAGISVLEKHTPSIPVGRNTGNIVYNAELKPMDLLTHKTAELHITHFLFQSPESGNNVIHGDIPVYPGYEESGSDEPYEGGFISDIDEDYADPGLLADDEFSKLLPITVCIPDSDEPEQLDIHESEVNQYFKPPEIRVRYVPHLEGADVHSREYHIYMAGEASEFHEKDDDDPDWETAGLNGSCYEPDGPVSGIELDTIYQGDASNMMTSCNSTFTYYDESGNRYQSEILPNIPDDTRELIDHSSCTLCKELSMNLLSYCGKHSQCFKCLKGNDVKAKKAQYKRCPECNMPDESEQPEGGFKFSVKDYPDLNRVFSQLYVKCPFGDGCSKVISCTELGQHSQQEDHVELCDICNTPVFRPVFPIHYKEHVDANQVDPKQAYKKLTTMIVTQGNKLRQCQTELVSCRKEVAACQQQVETYRADIQKISESFHQRLLRLEPRPAMPLPYEITYVLENYSINRAMAAQGVQGYLSLWSPVYDIPHGYSFQLRVYLDGDGQGKKSHLSVFFCLVRGENDDQLPWPFAHKVKFTLCGVGWHGDASDAFKPDRSDSFEKPKSERNKASGCPRFVNLNDMYKYIDGDSLTFKCTIYRKN